MQSPEVAEKFERYIRNIPNLHSWDGGVTWNAGGFSATHLRTICELLRSNPERARVLETGAGNSTVCFLLAGASEVTSIAPDESLFDRIADYCRQNGIDLGPLRTVVSLSETALPAIAAEATRDKKPIDFALLDGGHGWPTVFVDFCYTYAMLRQGGWMMIDDIQLHSVKELARFMMKAWQFELVSNLQKSLIFRKTTDQQMFGDFGGQPYIMERTEEDAAAGRAYVIPHVRADARQVRSGE
jgi:hypothetical protein